MKIKRRLNSLLSLLLEVHCDIIYTAHIYRKEKIYSSYVIHALGSMVVTCNPRRSWLDMASPNVARYRCCHIGETVHLDITGPTRGVLAINFSDSFSLLLAQLSLSLFQRALSLSFRRSVSRVALIAASKQCRAGDTVSCVIPSLTSLTVMPRQFLPSQHRMDTIGVERWDRPYIWYTWGSG